MTHEPRDAASFMAAYEIRVRGELGAAWSDWFAGPVVAGQDEGDTVLAGTFDQAALHAVLRRIRDLGLPLISVRRTEPDRVSMNETIESAEGQA